MACHLDGAKPLSESMLEYCWLDPWEQTAVKFQSEFTHFIQEKALENVVCEMASSCLGPNELTPWGMVVHLSVSDLSPAQVDAKPLPELLLTWCIEIQIH